jgi:hypothetical protein
MAELRKSSANLDRISGSPLLGASRRHKMGEGRALAAPGSAGIPAQARPIFTRFLAFSPTTVASCQLSVATREHKRELMRPILDPFWPVVFALQCCPHRELSRR